MPSLKFERPVGAAADLAELQYISALHQTSPELRPDGSIESVDISLFLRSRYGIDVTEEEVRDVILRGGLSCGAEGPGSVERIDLVELVAALLIPELLSAARQENSIDDDASSDSLGEWKKKEGLHAAEEQAGLQPPTGIIGSVLNAILEATFDNESNQHREINSELVHRILLALGEYELANDGNLVTQMVQAATSLPEQGSTDDPEHGPEILGTKSFARALVSDIDGYGLEQHINSSRSNYYDAFGVELPQPAPGRLASLAQRHFVVKKDSKQINPAGDTEESKEENDGQEAPFDQEERAGGKSSVGLSFVCAVNDSRDDKKLATCTLKDHGQQREVRHFFTAPAIDFTADTYASKTVATCLWVFLLLHVLASGTFNLQDFPNLVPTQIESCPDTANIGCDTLEVLLAWVNRIFTLIVIGAFVILGLGSLGNTVDPRPSILFLISFFPALYFFIKPFTSIGTSVDDLKGEPHRQWALAVSFFVALVIALEKTRQFIFYYLPRRWINKSARVEKFFSQGLTGSESERKYAAAHKVNLLLQNAIQIHEHINEEIEGTNAPSCTKPSMILTNFYEKSALTEKTGGYLWTLRAMKTRDLFTKEGVQFSMRLVAANVAQWVICVYIILFVKRTVENFIEAYDNKVTVIFIRTVQSSAKALVDRVQDLSNVANSVVDIFFHQMVPAIETYRVNSCTKLSSKGFNHTEIGMMCNQNNTLFTDIMQNADSFKALVMVSLFDQIDPSFKTLVKGYIDNFGTFASNVVTIVDPLEPWMIQMAFGIGGLIAFCCSLYLATLYLPSVSTTTLKFRSGAIKSLEDPSSFQEYRTRIHLTTYLTGGLFWGALIYCAGIAFVIGFGILILIWFARVAPVLLTGDPPQAPGFWGQVLGTVLAFVLQWALFASCACAVYRSFYRRRPGWANIHTLFWEAAWIGLSILFVLTRMLKLIVVAALQVGRVDTPFLADGVGKVFGLNLDGFPEIFRKDILIHEAHRHPYIERIGKLYLMKLRHGKNFVNTAGSGWRTIFVLTLMPWIKKYRTMARYGPDWKNPRCLLADGGKNGNKEDAGSPSEP